MGITPVQFRVAADEHATLNIPPIDKGSPTVGIQPDGGDTAKAERIWSSQ